MSVEELMLKSNRCEDLSEDLNNLGDELASSVGMLPGVKERNRICQQVQS